MADISITTFKSKKYKDGASTASPGFVEGDPGSPVNPPGTGGVSQFVPYVGALNSVNLGEKGLSTGFITLDTTPTGTPATQGTMFWDEDDDTVDIVLNGYIMKVGEDLFYPVKNQTGSNIAKGVAVRFAGTVGASGRLLIEPFIADGSVASTRFMGVTAEAIDNGEDGKVLWFGRIRGINTNSFNEGDILYASTTSAGGFQTAIPVAPNNIIQVAAVVTKSTTNGVIFVRPTLGSNINKDEGVKITSGITGDLLQLQAGGLWENKSVTDVLGGFVTGLDYQGTWNADTNTPTITSSTGTAGYYYIVDTDGSTNIDGITTWTVGDWIIFNGSVWQKIDNTDLVASVNGYVGVVNLVTGDIAEGAGIGSSQLYFTDARARQAIGISTSGSSGASSYDNTTGVINIPNYTLAGLGGVPTTRELTINGTTYDLSADRSWTIATVDANKVSYNQSDNKNATERNQARTNIGVTSMAPQVISTTGAINDLVITSNSLVFSGSSVVLSGITAGLDGEEVTIMNVNSVSLSILSQSTLSSAGNRIIGEVTIPQWSIVRLKYRTTTNRWVLENVGINDSRYVRKDISDTKIGNLVFLRGGSQFIRIRPVFPQNDYGEGCFEFLNFNSLSADTLFRFFSSTNVMTFGILANGNGRMTGRFEQARSNSNNTSTRRDELYLNYSQTVATVGTINNLPINADCKLLILTACDDLTGVVFVDNTRLLRIEARGISPIIRNQSASSTAANRFALGADLTINDGEVYQFIYTNSRWRRVL